MTRDEEIAMLSVLSDQDLVLKFEQELAPEAMETEPERILMRRFFNIARAGAGLPTVDLAPKEGP